MSSQHNMFQGPKKKGVLQLERLPQLRGISFLKNGTLNEKYDEKTYNQRVTVSGKWSFVLGRTPCGETYLTSSEPAFLIPGGWVLPLEPKNAGNCMKCTDPPSKLFSCLGWRGVLPNFQIEVIFAWDYTMRTNFVPNVQQKVLSHTWLMSYRPIYTIP